MFDKLFKVFSRREQSAEGAETKPLTPEFRNRVIMALQDEFQSSFGDLLSQIHRKVAYLHGKAQLTEPPSGISPEEDLLSFLFTCKDEHFLDVIEILFGSHFQGVTWPDNSLIPCINEFFRIDDLPFHLTGFVVEEYQSSFHGSPTTGIRITDYPTVIRRDSELLHQKALEPALRILSGSEFKQANSEFLRALTDHRKGEFNDCLTRCGSAFESVMKVLCKKKSISFKETDTASTLLKTLLGKSTLETYWEQPLILIATLRNRLSSSHGAGTKPKNTPEHVATYVVNATASAVLLLSAEFS